MVEWWLDCEDCGHLTVVGLHDTGPRTHHVGRLTPHVQHEVERLQTADLPRIPLFIQSHMWTLTLKRNPSNKWLASWKMSTVVVMCVPRVMTHWTVEDRTRVPRKLPSLKWRFVNVVVPTRTVTVPRPSTRRISWTSRPEWQNYEEWVCRSVPPRWPSG